MVFAIRGEKNLVNGNTMISGVVAYAILHEVRPNSYFLWMDVLIDSLQSDSLSISSPRCVHNGTTRGL